MSSPAPAAAFAPSENPLLAPSALPFEAPPFDRLRDEHYQPAIEEGMRQHLAEVLAIANSSEPPTFDNTIVALERSGDLLTRALKAFTAVTSANTNDTLQDIQAEVAPRLAGHSDAIYLNDALFQRVSAVHDTRDRLATAEQRHLIERYVLEFVRSGARLNDDDKARLRELNQDESKLTTEFNNRLLAASKAGALIFNAPDELEGLTEAELSAAAMAAEDRGLSGKWLLPLSNTTQQPAQDSLQRRDVRERLFNAAQHRADRGDANDTRALIKRIAQVRAERAQLLGYATAAAYILDDQTAKTPEAAERFLIDIARAAVANARGEATKIQALIDKSGGGFTLEPWDWQLYAEKVRKAEYDLDEAQIKPYFVLERVLVDGVFFAANQLYGLTFQSRDDIPVYHPDVRVYEVFDHDGSSLALLYVDPYKRDNKHGGAWMDAYVDQSRLLDKKPVIVNVTNFAKPAPGQPTLLGFDEVTTMFHEFGHALHGMFSSVEYPMLTGTNVPRDFVEFPSQFNEHWALEPRVFARYARHYVTGEPMPQVLVDRIKKSRTFNQGFALTEYIAAALLDLAWHTIAPERAPTDVDAFQREALTRYHVDVREVPPRYSSTYFAHIWEGGYGAGYYAYLWAEVLDHDAFAWFAENGGMTRENGRKFRDAILSRGGTQDAAELYRAFRGREPVIDPLLAERGLKPEPGDS
ncbi:MAG TPA: M3 family metallopeptidase [Gemmatimonadaceae bacterium]